MSKNLKKQFNMMLDEHGLLFTTQLVTQFEAISYDRNIFHMRGSHSH